MVKVSASDMYLKPGSSPHLRISAQLQPSQVRALTQEEIAAMADELMNDLQRETLARRGSVDLAYQLGADRFRINIFRQLAVISIAIRFVRRDVPDFKALNLPGILGKIADKTSGLVVVSGPTSNGKSTTIASMLEYINSRRACHIITLEDPIEYLFENKMAIISQREIGIDVPSFELALRDLARQAPDVVLVGEIRDYITFRTAIRAVEIGHLVFGTVHAPSAARTITRMIGLSPADSRDMAGRAIMNNLRAVICQRLLPCIQEDISCIPAVEILLMNPAVKMYIRDDRVDELTDVVRSCEKEGMQTLAMSLLKLIESDRITPEVGYDAAVNAEELKMLIRGITTVPTGMFKRSDGET